MILTKHEKELLDLGCHVCKIEMPDLNKLVWWLTPGGDLILSMIVNQVASAEGIMSIDSSWVVQLEEKRFRFVPVSANHIWKEYESGQINSGDALEIGKRYWINNDIC